MAATVQSILQEYFEQFAQNHPLSYEQRLAAEPAKSGWPPGKSGCWIARTTTSCSRSRMS